MHRHHGEAKGRIIGHVDRRPGTFVYVEGDGTVRETMPHRTSRRHHGDARHKGKHKKKGSRRR
jgi:hypothetical protein